MEERVIISTIVSTIAVMREILDDCEDDEGRPILEKNENFYEVTIPNFNDQQFKQHFRVRRNTLERLLNDVQHIGHQETENLNGRPELELEKQLLLFLWYLSNLECFRSVADRFGVSKNCAWISFYRICNKLLQLNQTHQIISFPQGERALQVVRDFESIDGFPGILGVIDGTHIRINKPPEGNAYINRKSYASVLLQGICDSKKRFLDVYSGEPGSIHDYRLLTKSDFYHRMRQREIIFKNDQHLIGDLAYKLSSNLMVGYKDNGHLDATEIFFNQSLNKVRVVIENAFGLLKGRFRRLKMLDTRRLDLIPLLIISGCILHNICLSNEDYFHEVHIEINDADIVHNFDVDVDLAAIAKRESIKNLLFVRNNSSN